jgi:hypothetical protein
MFESAPSAIERRRPRCTALAATGAPDVAGSAGARRLPRDHVRARKFIGFDLQIAKKEQT